MPFLQLSLTPNFSWVCADPGVPITALAASIRTTIMQLRARTAEIWTAVAERSGDNAFRAWPSFPKRRGASLPAALHSLRPRRKERCVHFSPSVVNMLVP
jgi:hypothetical protein